MKTIASIILALVLMVISISGVDALMSSSSYRIFGDSFTSGGGDGSSASYILDGSAGEDFAGSSSSASYVLLEGLQSLSEHPTFTFTTSVSSIALGTLDAGVIKTGTVNLITSTNAPFGYTTTIIDDGNLRSGVYDINDVSDGSVTVGSEEYGITTSGTDSVIATDVAITTTPLIVATRSSWKNGASTTVTFKAAMSATTTQGSYSHEIFYISTGNF